MMQLMSGSSQASSLFPATSGTGAHVASWPSFSPYCSTQGFSGHPPSPTSASLSATSSAPLTSHCTSPLYVPTTHAPLHQSSALAPVTPGLAAPTPATSSSGLTYDPAPYSSSLSGTPSYPTGALPLPASGAGLGLGYSSAERPYGMMTSLNKGYYGGYSESLPTLGAPGFMTRPGTYTLQNQ